MPRDHLGNIAWHPTVGGAVGLIHRGSQDGSAHLVRELRLESRPDFRWSPWRVAGHALRHILFVERCSGLWPSPSP